MSAELVQQSHICEGACLDLIQRAADAGGDGDVLYQAQINAQQAMMWLRKALGAEAPPPSLPQAPPFDDSPPPEDAEYVRFRMDGEVKRWWRWRDRKWVLFQELPEESQVRAMGSDCTVA